MKLISVSVIIPVFNGLNFTKICLENLRKEQKLVNQYRLEIVVVDDGSTDGTYEWIRKNHPDVHILAGDGNLWWSGGINRGMEYAFRKLLTDYVLWWNNDIITVENYFGKLFSILSSLEEAIVLGSKVFMLNKNLIWGMGGKFDPHTGKRFMYGESIPDGPDYQKPLDVDWFPGMGTAIHSSVMEKIGMLDETRFPQYHGDSDYTFRAKKAGFKLIAHPDLIIFNDNTNTGLKHDGDFRKFYQTLSTIKSNYNFKKDFLFFKVHATSIRAYSSLINKYGRYIAGFFKWKILTIVGVKKSL